MRKFLTLLVFFALLTPLLLFNSQTARADDLPAPTEAKKKPKPEPTPTPRPRPKPGPQDGGADDD